MQTQFLRTIFGALSFVLLAFSPLAQAGSVTNPSSVTILNYTGYPWNSCNHYGSAQVTLHSDGTVTYGYIHADCSWTTGLSGGNWYTPATSGIGSTPYYFNMIESGGSDWVTSCSGSHPGKICDGAGNGTCTILSTPTTINFNQLSQPQDPSGTDTMTMQIFSTFCTGTPLGTATYTFDFTH